jgi:uncharacterized protein with NRDE domain
VVDTGRLHRTSLPLRSAGMCTVFVRLDPGAPWPVLLGAIRDEFVARPWDPPARHWDGDRSSFLGGRDRAAGGTWLAVDPSPERPAVAALLNGLPRHPRDQERPPRPTRGELALRVLAGGGVPTGAELEPYDRFHLLVATRRGAELWTWDAEAMTHHRLGAGRHIVVNLGLDATADPLVPHFAPLLDAVADPDPHAGDWGRWPELLAGDGLAGDDERALIVRKEVEGRSYGSTSGTLVGLAADGRVRYDFTATPAEPASWAAVPVR